VNYLFYRRIRGPVFLLTFGVTAALAVWHVIGFEKSWPLYLIVYGVLRLAEGAALAAAGSAATPLYPTPSYPAQGYAPSGGSAYQGTGTAGVTAPGTGLATIPPTTLQRASTTEEES
jgi:hypothetical protein